MTKLVKVALAYLTVIVALNANAGMITYNNYTLDESSNIVTGGGLEWIQWDETIGMSIQEAGTDIADGILNGTNYGVGWGIASNEQMAELFNSFGFGATFSWDIDESSSQSTHNNDGFIESLSSDPEKQIVKLFGNTWKNHPGNVGSSDHLEFTSASFGLDKDNNGLFNNVRIFDDYIYGNNSGHWGGVAELQYDWYTSNAVNGVGGVALVRQIQTSIPVPEPSMFSLLLLGLIGIVVKRRNH